MTRIAANDIALARNYGAGPARVALTLAGTPLASLVGDGVLFASPGGSTAHNLNAGGPVLSPLLRALVLRTLNARAPMPGALVLHEDEPVTVLRRGRTARRWPWRSTAGSWASCRRACEATVGVHPTPARLLRTSPPHFFGELAERLAPALTGREGRRTRASSRRSPSAPRGSWSRSTGLRMYEFTCWSYAWRMSSSDGEVVSTTTGMRRRSGSPFTFASTWRPSTRGRLRSSSMRSGRGAPAMLALAMEELERLGAVAGHVQARRRVRGLLQRLLREAHVRRVVLDEEDVDEASVAHAGSVKRNTVPPSFLGSTQIRPRCVATILAQTARPMPVPSCPAAARWNGWKMRSACSAGTPMPLSAIDTSIRSPSIWRAETSTTRGRLGPELHRVRDEVLEQLAQLRGVAGDGRQPLGAHGRVLVADLRVQVVEDLRQRRGEVDALRGRSRPARRGRGRAARG